MKKVLNKIPPILLKYWDYDKNNKLEYYPENYGIGSHQKVWWKCEKGHEWESAIYHIKDRGCPYCARKKTIIGENDLTTTHPHLMKEWDYVKNTINPKTLFATSSKKVWWRCEDGHEWESTIKNRSRGRNCPICSNQKIIAGINDLETLSSELIKEWNFEKNKISPKEVSLNSRKEVWWKCEYGHEWKDSINHRTQGRNCPICSNRQIIEGINDLSTTHPKIALEWNYERNKELKPTEVSIGSKKKVWWKCSKCNKEWQSVIYSRKNCGCPRCKESKGEKYITEYLDKNHFVYETQYRFSDCKNIKPLPFDFAVMKDNQIICLIEYDGEQHFKESSIYNRESLSEIQKRDSIKTNYCKNNNLKLIRISYKDFNHIDNILDEKLNFILKETIYS